MKNIDTHMKEWRIRLRILADIVFASAMTIMVGNIEIPDIEKITGTLELGSFLLKQLSNMMVFIVTFVVIAVYWLKHLEYFSAIHSVNQNFIWLQLLFLGSIMLIPFWNTYISLFPENIAMRVFLSLNMILVGLFSFLSIHYASKPANDLVDSNLPKEQVKQVKLEVLTEPFIALLAAGMAFINVDLWDWTFLLVPLLFFARKRFLKYRTK